MDQNRNLSFRQFLDESINDAGILKAVFIVGLPGAGKSYTLKKLVGKISPVVVNTDRAAEHIGRKKQIVITSKNWAEHIEDDALRITSTMLTNYLNGLLPLFVDGTSNNVARIMHRYGILESLGYDVGIVFVDTPIETAIQRAKERSKNIGREVDEDFIREVYSTNEDNVAYLKSKTSFFKKITNDHTLDDETLQQAFKSVQGFFSGNVMNPVGKRTIEKLRASKQKYLTPTIMDEQHLKNLVIGWYK
jgi:predicted ABC-type ATPase